MRIALVRADGVVLACPAATWDPLAQLIRCLAVVPALGTGTVSYLVLNNRGVEWNVPWSLAPLKIEIGETVTIDLTFALPTQLQKVLGLYAGW